MRRSQWLLVLWMMGAVGCAGSGKTQHVQEGDAHAQTDAPSAPDVADGDSAAADATPLPDQTDPADATDAHAEGVLRATLTPSSEALADARVYLEIGDGKSGEVTVKVMASGLGTIAGMAFTLDHDPAKLKLAGVQNLAELGKTASIETRSIMRQLGPTRTAFGVARFCLAKMPWGDVDQCGGVAVQEPTPIAEFRFELLSEGLTGLTFEADSTLIRRPDRSAVTAQWLNGSLRIGRE